MKATIYDILDKKKWNPFAFVDSDDFQLRETGETDAREILRDAQITLYALDFENGRAVFVETPPEIDLSQAPFYYVSQYENALRVLTVPFDTMFELAETVAVDDRKLIFVYSTGRAGSTLASKILAMLEYCGCLPEDLSCVYEALAKDSQAGSPIAQQTIGQQDRELQESDLQELQRHRQAHPFINNAGFEVANTLKL